MKYKLINTTTNQETICDKVTIEGFDYYVSDESSNGDYLLRKEFYINLEENKLCQQNDSEFMKWMGHTLKRPIATTNPNIDIPKVVDDYKNASWWAADLYGYDKNCELPTNDVEVNSFIEGYNKSQETHSNSDEDMVDFYEWCDTSEEATIFWKRNKVDPDMSGNHWKKIRENREKLLQLWKEQQPKKVYYD